MKFALSVSSAALSLLVASGAVAQTPPSLENLLLPAPQPAATTVVPAQPQPVQVPQPAMGDPSAFSAPPEATPPAPTAQEVRDADFQNALQAAFPMSPEQIMMHREMMEGRARASVMPVAPGRPVSRSLRLSLKPGEETPVVRIEPGVVSTLTFSDGTGQPWPIQSVVTGNPDAFLAQSAGPEGRSNILVISARQAYIPSNLVVTLVNHPVPVSMVLAASGAETDYRVDVQVGARGPNALAQAPAAVPLAPTDDGTMMSFLDGVPPTGANRLRTSSGDVEVWAFSDMLYVRTPGEIMSPGYMSRSSNVSGVNVFSMADTPVLLVSRDGRMSSVQIMR